MYPIGRAVARKEEGNPITAKDIQFIFTDPGCGDKAETHTVREWLKSFDIPIKDEFFVKWQQTIFDVGSLLRKAEKAAEAGVMPLLWSAVFEQLYMQYDTEKEFMPQFDENTEQLLYALKNILAGKGGDRHE